jgi:hypothetical protein
MKILIAFHGLYIINNTFCALVEQINIMQKKKKLIVCNGDGIEHCFKLFIKLTIIKGFRNSKHQYQDWIRGSIKKNIKLELESKVPFEVKNQKKFI